MLADVLKVYYLLRCWNHRVVLLAGLSEVVAEGRASFRAVVFLMITPHIRVVYLKLLLFTAVRLEVGLDAGAFVLSAGGLGGRPSSDLKGGLRRGWTDG